MPGGERRVELADAVPLLGDEAEVHGPTAALEDRLKDAVVAGGVGAVDALAVQAADAGAEPHADHPEGGEVDLGVAVGVGVVLFEVEVALVVEDAVEHEGRVAVGALDRAAVERGVVVGDEGVELEREVVEARAIGPLQHLVRHGEALPVAGRRRAVAPMAGGVEAGDAMDDGGERGALVLLDETPIADVLEPPVGDVGRDLLHGVEAEVAAVGEDRSQQRADLAGVDPLLARLLEVDAESEVVLDLDEQVGQPDRATAGVQPAVQLGEAVRLRRVGLLGRVRLEPPPVVVECDGRPPIAGGFLPSVERELFGAGGCLSAKPGGRGCRRHSGGVAMYGMAG